MKLSDEELALRRRAREKEYRATRNKEIRAYRAKWREKNRRKIAQQRNERYHATKTLTPKPPAVVDGQQTCVVCGMSKPATGEHFYLSCSHKSGLDTNCKICRRLKKKLSGTGIGENHRVIYAEDRVESTGPIIRERTPSGGVLVTFHEGWKPERRKPGIEAFAGYASGIDRAF